MSSIEINGGIVNPILVNPNQFLTLRSEEVSLQRETEPTQIMFAGIATGYQKQQERLELLTSRYLDREYITPEDLTNGLYIDKYESTAVPIIAQYQGKVVASARLIPNDPHIGLPIINDNIPIDKQWREVLKKIPFEVSQFAKSEKFKFSRKEELYITYAILRGVFGIMQQYNTEEAVAVVDKAVFEKIFNGLYHFDLPQIGDAVYYKGSISIPTYINISNMLSSCHAAGKEELATFFGTGNSDKFDWYQGV